MTRSVLGTLLAIAIVTVIERAGIGWGILAGAAGLAGSCVIDLAVEHEATLDKSREATERAAPSSQARRVQ